MRATGHQEMKTARQMLYARVRFFLKQMCNSLISLRASVVLRNLCVKQIRPQPQKERKGRRVGMFLNGAHPVVEVSGKDARYITRDFRTSDCAAIQ